jgi:uncharacterized protein YdeI (YjbR/CyaY-like superfamily)
VGKKDTRIDEFIANSADFARPILRHIRKLIHTACPQVEETIKWRFPSYNHKGILCMTPAFKNHAALIFWRPEVRSLLKWPGPASEKERFRKITSLAELPKDSVLIQTIKQAVKLNESGPKKKLVSRKTKKLLAIPAYLFKVLKKTDGALAAFQKLSPSHQNEYIEWITEAKREETRNKRIGTMMLWLQEGKSRNWKYEK